jgi:hypothetical protein
MNSDLTNRLSCKLRLEWLPVGVVAQDADGKVRFPTLPTKPGLYQFKIFGRDGSQAIYVGETDNLQRRFAHYRNPGPTQATNLRLNALFKELLSKGATIEVEIVTDQAWISWSESEVTADLARKSVRRLFENFVLCAERASEVEDLNR